jgi:uncharacterized protein YbaR (Trm112 family)
MHHADMTTLPFDQDLFDLLVCPLARTPLTWVDGRLVSLDPATRRAYRVEGDIPVMLIDEATTLDETEWKRLMAAGGPVGQGAEAVRKRHGRG